MELDFAMPKQVSMRMDQYVANMLKEFQAHDLTDVTGDTPAAKHLFEINNKATPMTEEQGNVVHTFVAKVLFLTKRARPDMHTAVAFLSTRVKNPDKDDLKNFKG